MEAGATGALAAAKLQPPAAPAVTVRRPRLETRLDDAVGVLHRFALVSAPAGSGKSTLVASWASARAEPVAWLRVDARDSDPVLFWTDLATAIDASAPNRDESTASLVAMARDDDRIVTALVDRLTAANDALIVVIDDFHLIEHQRVHAGVERLVDRCPDAITIVIATRFDPSFRLDRRRARSELVEIRAADLRFDRDEATDLLAPFGLASRHIGDLCERAEGWAAGLVLAAVSLAHRDDVDGFVASFRSDDRYLVELLRDALLSSVPDDDRRRLLETAVLDELSGPLVDAVTSSTDGAEWLATTAAVNPLLIGLDQTGTWYRYHQLLGDLLRLELSRRDADRAAELHAAAAEWYRHRGDLLAAIDHHLSADATTIAADLIADGAASLLAEGRVVTLRRQLDRLGDECERHAGCAAARGWTNLVTGRVADARDWHDRAARLDIDGDDTGRLVALGTMVSLAEGDVGAALARSEPTNAPADSTAALASAAARVWAGRFDAARPYLSIARDLAAAEPSDLVASVALVYEAIIEAEQGHLDAAGRLARRALDHAAEHGTTGAAQLSIAHCLAAHTAGDPDEAIAAARSGVELARRAPENQMHAYALTCAGDVLRSRADATGSELLRSARTIIDRCVDPGIARSRLAAVEARHGVARPSPLGLVEELTDREAEVLRYLATALSQREIAAQLFVSLNTVKSHCSAIYRKLGVADRSAAVQAARDLEGR